jgi:hypothetical protein
MTRLPAKVLSNEKQGDRYCVVVEIELPNFRRSFNSLRFGDQIPFSGSCRDGKLELHYYQDPGLEIGQQFSLWLSELRNKGIRLTPSHQTIGASLDSVSFPLLKLFARPFRVRKSISLPFSQINKMAPVKRRWVPKE